MKKQHIILISVLVLLIIGGGIYFLTKPKNNGFSNNFNERQGPGNMKELNIDDVAEGNHVTAFMENNNAVRIMVCENAETCQMSGNKGENQQPPAGNQKPNDNMEDVTILSGIVIGKASQSIIIETDSGGSETIIVSDETQILRRD